MLKDKRLFTMVLSSLFLCGVLGSIPVFAQDNSNVTERLSGINRYETSNAISKAGFGQATTIIITSGIDYPDDLAASALSKSNNAPIILASKDALAVSSLTEITRLKATKALIIGGTGVIGTGVEKQLKSLKIEITRIGGIDRYDTSRKVAELVGVTRGIIIAANLDFPDPLSIAPIAAIKGMPILLTPSNSLNPNIAAFIKGKSVPVSYLVGGTGVLGESIASSVPSSKRLSGNTRYTTNLSIINEFADELNFDTIYLASGNDFPDALSGSAIAAKNNAPLFLTDKNSISTAALNLIKTKKVKHVVILGGTGSISASVENNVITAINSIPVSVASVSLNKSTDALTVGGSDIISAAIAPANATDKSIIWTSTNRDIVTVDNTGKVTAISAGTATVIATTSDGSYTAPCTVTVALAPIVKATAVSLDETSDVLFVGGIYKLTASVAPQVATNKTIIWTTSDNAIASVDNTGKVTALSAGKATITATTEDGSYTAACTFTSNIVPIVSVTGVSLAPTTDAIAVGRTYNLIATITPYNATNKVIRWTSSNTSVAVVDYTGKVTGVTEGTAAITAITSDGSKTAVWIVTVSAVDPTTQVSSVNLNKTTDTLGVGSTDILIATLIPSTSVNKSVIWTTSDNSVASVESNGKVTAVSIGTATITVTTSEGGYVATCIVSVTKKALIKIAIDAGHGGYDAGAVGPTGVLEKTVNLAIALKVGAILQQHGIDVVYTRISDSVSWPSDVGENLQAICDIANNAKVNYFVSIHSNSSSDPSAHGTETYYYAGNTIGQKIALAVQQGLESANALTNRGIKTANYYVLKYTNVPAILAEVAFISNPYEESLLNSSSFQNTSAIGIANGILKAVN